VVARKKQSEAIIEITRHADTSLGRRKIGEQVSLPCDEAEALVSNRVAKFISKPVEIVEPVESDDAD
jgi:hypothetical protein